MRFEARELKPYVEPVKAADLEIGRPYFRVAYIDEDMVVPELETLVFIGRNLHPDGPGFYFQDAASFLAGARFDPTEFGSFPEVEEADHDHFTFEMNDTWFDVYPEGENTRVLDFDEALECLMQCSIGGGVRCL